MNKLILELAKQAGLKFESEVAVSPQEQKFAELLIAKVLDEVAERAYYSGDRAWCDDLDRQWVELEFDIGELARLKNGPR